MSEPLPIGAGIVLPADDLTFRTSRASGPGGQNVNKVETRVTLLFDLDGTAALDAGQKELVRERLAGRIGKSGLLRVSSQRHRTQRANREAARERLAGLLAAALERQPPRRPTRPRRAARERRLADKRRRSELKRRRRPPDSDPSDR